VTPEQQAYLDEAVSFANACVRPQVAQWEADQAIPRALVEECGRRGFLGCNVDPEYGGSRVDHVRLGFLHYAIGKACSSLRSVLTVHGMVCEVLQRWGSRDQRQRWLPQLASGKAIAAFALTEPQAGSDARAIGASAVPHERGFAVTGEKCWVTGGQIADVFLVFAKHDGRDTAFLLERGVMGLTVTPVTGMLGLRAAMLGSLSLAGCVVPPHDRVGGAGFGVDAIAAAALDLGRFAVAWGCVGLAEACLEASFRQARSRTQFGKPLEEHQLISAMLSDMVTNVRAASLVCLHAAKLRDREDPSAMRETCVAKYFASRACTRVAADTVQIHGAAGCAGGHEAERCYRDAKIMEIIEGSTQIHQTLIARLARDAMEWPRP
jgi:alkylation response protein AidB-like acyl-CoA dehydrogenase